MKELISFRFWIFYITFIQRKIFKYFIEFWVWIRIQIHNWTFLNIILHSFGPKSGSVKQNKISKKLSAQIDEITLDDKNAKTLILRYRWLTSTPHFNLDRSILWTSLFISGHCRRATNKRNCRKVDVSVFVTLSVSISCLECPEIQNQLKLRRYVEVS